LSFRTTLDSEWIVDRVNGIMMRHFTHFLASACLLLSICVFARSQKLPKPELIVQTGHTDKGLSGQFALGGKLIVTAGLDHTIKIWNTETGTLLKTFTGFNPGRADAGFFLRISPDGKQAVAIDLHNGIKILNLETGSVLPMSAPSFAGDEGRSATADHGLGPISDLIFGPDGKQLFAVDAVRKGDKTTYAIRTWDLGGGKSLARSLENADVTPDKFSPDANLILGSYPSANKTDVTVVNVWDRASGRMVFKRSYPGCSDVQFSPDSKLLIMFGSEKIRLLEARTGQELSTTDLGGKARDVRFSHNGQLLAAEVQIRQNQTSLTQVVIWGVSSGRIVQRLTIGTGYINDVSLVWSPDDSMIACKMDTDSDNDKGMIQVWDVQSGNKLREVHRAQSELGPFLGPRLDWSPDGKYLVTFGADGATHLWNPGTGTNVRNLAGQNRSTDYVAFSPDGNYFISEKESRHDTDNLQASFSLWDLRDGSLLSRTKGQFKAFSHDSKIIVTETKGQDRAFLVTSRYAPNNDAEDKEDETNLWNVNGGTAPVTFPGRFLNLSADNEKLITRSQAKGVVVWDAKTRVALRTLATYHDVTSFAVVSDDGTYLVSGWNNGQTINLIDVASGRTLQSLTGFPTEKEDPPDYESLDYIAAFSHDNRLLACRRGGLGGGETLLIWDVKTGALLKRLKGAFGLAPHLAFSSDNLTLVSMANEITFIDVQTGKEITDVFERGATGYQEEMLGVDMSTSSFYSPDGRFFASLLIGDSLDLGILDLSNHKAPAFLKDGTFKAAAFGPDTKTLALTGQDNSIQFWDLQTGKLLITALDMDEDGWLTITPDGRFDGTSGAWQKIFWRFTANVMEVVPVEVFFGDFYYPSLLSDVLNHRNLSSTQDLSAKDRRQPQLNLTLANDQANANATARNVAIKVNVSQAPAGAQDVRLLRNGSLVKVWHGDVLQGQTSVTLEATVPIVAGENRLTAYAFNRDNIKSTDTSLVVNGASDLKRAGTLYVLAIGSNRYESKGYDLKFALADVDEISKQVKAYQDKLGVFARTEIISLTDEEATKANLMLALRRFADGSQTVPPTAPLALKQQLEKIKNIEPEDGLLIYYAGHGTAIGQHFYLLPHDFVAGNEAQVKASSISDLELNEVLERVDAGKLLMVIDACQSGQALGGEKEGRGPMNSKGLAQLAYDKGMYILTAAQGYQAANEVSRSQTGKTIQHGLLTFALLEGLSKAAKDNEGRITEREWMKYAVDQVPLMQIQEMKNRSMTIGQRGTQLVFVDGDNAAVDPEKRNVQRPRVFYRRELEAQPLVVARP
jgi:WD40 repeat protein